MMSINRPRGTEDMTPQESPGWHYLAETARRTARRFGYGEIRTPVMEHRDLFVRTVGQSTDIVEKEMYTFEDRGGRSLTLRAEGTAPAARLYLQQNLFAEAQPVKLYYVNWPIFRYERPQAGRLRQHHQFGVECFGSSDPAVDAEIISLALQYLADLGLVGLQVSINNIGCPDCRDDYRQALMQHFSLCADDMCEDCCRRLQDNPLRILDCKRDECQEYIEQAPVMTEFLCSECADHYSQLQKYLQKLDIGYQCDPTLVRGLDYYTRTVFEITHSALGAKDVVCGGGRYDGLVEILGGEPTPGVGFGMGLERLLLILEAEDAHLPAPAPLDAFVVTIGDAAHREAVSLLKSLRESKISCDMDYLDRSVRAQMRYADKYPARFVLMLGEDEIQAGQITVRNMETGEQSMVDMGIIADYLAEKIDSDCV